MRFDSPIWSWTTMVLLCLAIILSVITGYYHLLLWQVICLVMVMLSHFNQTKAGYGITCVMGLYNVLLLVGPIGLWLTQHSQLPTYKNGLLCLLLVVSAAISYSAYRSIEWLPSQQINSSFGRPPVNSSIIRNSGSQPYTLYNKERITQKEQQPFVPFTGKSVIFED